MGVTDEGYLISPRITEAHDFNEGNMPHLVRSGRATPPPPITPFANEYYGQAWQNPVDQYWDPSSDDPPGYDWDYQPPNIQVNEASFRGNRRDERNYNSEQIRRQRHRDATRADAMYDNFNPISDTELLRSPPQQETGMAAALTRALADRQRHEREGEREERERERDRERDREWFSSL